MARPASGGAPPCRLVTLHGWCGRQPSSPVSCNCGWICTWATQPAVINNHTKFEHIWHLVVGRTPPTATSLARPRGCAARRFQQRAKAGHNLRHRRSVGWVLRPAVPACKQAEGQQRRRRRPLAAAQHPLSQLLRPRWCGQPPVCSSGSRSGSRNSGTAVPLSLLLALV